MRKFLFFLIFFPVIAFSQTKAETEEWIISKFNKWKEPIIIENDIKLGILASYIDFKSLEINDCDLIITKHEQTIEELADKVEKTKYVSTIKIGDIEEFHWMDNQLFITSRKWNILVKIYDDYTKKHKRTTYVKAANLCFNTDAENDLKNRIIKAFNHLKTYCKPTIDKKEPF